VYLCRLPAHANSAGRAALDGGVCLFLKSTRTKVVQGKKIGTTVQVDLVATTWAWMSVDMAVNMEHPTWGLAVQAERESTRLRLISEAEHAHTSRFFVPPPHAVFI
jgi:hypothetical protein